MLKVGKWSSNISLKLLSKYIKNIWQEILKYIQYKYSLIIFTLKKYILVGDCIKDSSKTPLKKNILKAGQTFLETLLIVFHKYTIFKYFLNKNDWRRKIWLV